MLGSLRRRGLVGAARAVLCAAAVAVMAGPGCGAEPSETNVGAQGEAMVGGAGSPTITSSTVVNRYTALTANAAAGATTLTVASGAALNAVAGDLLFIIQMQGAAVDNTNTATFGTVTNLNGA